MPKPVESASKSYLASWTTLRSEVTARVLSCWVERSKPRYRGLEADIIAEEGITEQMNKSKSKSSQSHSHK